MRTTEHVHNAVTMKRNAANENIYSGRGSVLIDLWQIKCHGIQIMLGYDIVYTTQDVGVNVIRVGSRRRHTCLFDVRKDDDIGACRRTVEKTISTSSMSIQRPRRTLGRTQSTLHTCTVYRPTHALHSIAAY